MFLGVLMIMSEGAVELLGRVGKEVCAPGASGLGVVRPVAVNLEAWSIILGKRT
jgi:hypothetical protein